DGGGPAGQDRGDRRAVRRWKAGPARRAHGPVRRLVVQRAAVEHGAAPAPERGGPHEGAVGRKDRGGALADTGGGVVSVDRELLEILACPNCRGDVEYRED